MSTLIDVGQWSALEGVEGRQSAKEAEGARSQRGVSNEVNWAGGDTGEEGGKEGGGGGCQDNDRKEGYRPCVWDGVLCHFLDSHQSQFPFVFSRANPLFPCSP